MESPPSSVHGTELKSPKRLRTSNAIGELLSPKAPPGISHVVSPSSKRLPRREEEGKGSSLVVSQGRGGMGRTVAELNLEGVLSETLEELTMKPTSKGGLDDVALVTDAGLEGGEGAREGAEVMTDERKGGRGGSGLGSIKETGESLTVSAGASRRSFFYIWWSAFSPFFFVGVIVVIYMCARVCECAVCTRLLLQHAPTDGSFICSCCPLRTHHTKQL